MGFLLLAALGLLALGGGSKSTGSVPIPKTPSGTPVEPLLEDETELPRESIPTPSADEAARRKAAMDVIRDAAKGKAGQPQNKGQAKAQTVKATKKKAVVAKKTAGKNLAASQKTQASKKAKLAPGGVYTIRKGGTLVAVAKLFGVSIAAIQTANPGMSISTKYGAGTKVRIP